jgi:hypothetical protein
MRCRSGNARSDCRHRPRRFSLEAPGSKINIHVGRCCCAPSARAGEARRMSTRSKASARLICVAALAPPHQAVISRTSFTLVFERDEHILYDRGCGLANIFGGT